MESLGTGLGAASSDAPSDGYGTGNVVYVLRQARVPAGHQGIQHGKTWLATNQRESGHWFTRSLNGVKLHSISDTTSIFAVLVLKASE